MSERPHADACSQREASKDGRHEDAMRLVRRDLHGTGINHLLLGGECEAAVDERQNPERDEHSPDDSQIRLPREAHSRPGTRDGLSNACASGDAAPVRPRALTDMAGERRLTVDSRRPSHSNSYKGSGKTYRSRCSSRARWLFSTEAPAFTRGECSIV